MRRTLPPALESGGNRRAHPSDAGFRLADLPSTTGGTTPWVEDASEPLLPVSGECPVVLHRDLDAVSEELSLEPR